MLNYLLGDFEKAARAVRFFNADLIRVRADRGLPHVWFMGEVHQHALGGLFGFCRRVLGEFASIVWPGVVHFWSRRSFLDGSMPFDEDEDEQNRLATLERLIAERQVHLAEHFYRLYLRDPSRLLFEAEREMCWLASDINAGTTPFYSRILEAEGERAETGSVAAKDADKDPTPAGQDDAENVGLLSATDLATYYRIENLGALRKRLERWRKDNPSGYRKDWYSVEDKKKGEAGYLYRPAAVAEHIADLGASALRQSTEG
jgi:hypothetical protein